MKHIFNASSRIFSMIFLLVDKIFEVTVTSFYAMSMNEIIHRLGQKAGSFIKQLAKFNLKLESRVFLELRVLLY